MYCERGCKINKGFAYFGSNREFGYFYKFVAFRLIRRRRLEIRDNFADDFAVSAPRVFDSRVAVGVEVLPLLHHLQTVPSIPIQSFE